MLSIKRIKHQYHKPFSDLMRGIRITASGWRSGEYTYYYYNNAVSTKSYVFSYCENREELDIVYQLAKLITPKSFSDDEIKEYFKEQVTLCYQKNIRKINFLPWRLESVI